ncbi:hypothetical protein [Kitasatospora sp. DSM 101779]|uniref:hypothetical protein n=1 Tax=Kitasatospora sp. DSM 101779 TaxID=2853165 RepID=UPI0021DAE4BB|nr:hypothetical protein [Kitasatospora sp. DSM 101779]MCU7823587.1 hypothetical protein [Kitasatospora sp. DSM 101779]
MDSSSAGPAPAPAIYPLPGPDDDPRFSRGLVLDLAAVLTEHGYPPITSGVDLLNLQQALFGFLYTLDVT